MGRFIGFLDRWSRWPKLSRIEKMSVSAIVNTLVFLLWLVSFGVIIGCAFNEVMEVPSSFVMRSLFIGKFIKLHCYALPIDGYRSRSSGRWLFSSTKCLLRERVRDANCF
jgi:hypothetical protein